MNPKFQPQFDPIQSRILNRLIILGKAKFSDLKPRNIENDLYNYHLKFLITKGLVQKSNKEYFLTTDGTRVISNFDIFGNVAQLFKASVALYIVRGSNSVNPEMLLQERKRAPFLGDITSIAGKIKYGERAEDAAKRKLQEESGLIADFRLIGVLRKTRKDKSGSILEDTIYHSCYAESPMGILQEDTIFGNNFWCPFSEVIDKIKNNVDGGDLAIKEVENILNGNLAMHYYHQISEVSKY